MNSKLPRLAIFQMRLCLIIASLILFPLSLPGQALIVRVLPFISEDPASGELASEIIRNGLASAPLIQVIEDGEADYSLELSTEHRDPELALSYRLFDNALGRVELAGIAAIRAETFQQDAVSVAAAINNVLLASYAGSTLETVDMLIKSNRLDEAQRRFDSLAARSASDARIAELGKRLARARAIQWRDTAQTELLQAKTIRGEQALRMAAQVSFSLEAALLLIPEGHADDTLHESIQSLLTGPLSTLRTRAIQETESEYVAKVRSALRTSQPDLALELYDDYRSLYGIDIVPKSLRDLRIRASRARASQLAALSRDALRDGQHWRALALAGQAIEADPESITAHKAYERAAITLGKEEALKEADRMIAYGEPHFFRGSWGYGIGIGLYGISGEDFSFPVQGAIPVPSIGLQRILRAGDTLMISFGGRFGLGRSTGNTQLFGLEGNIETALVSLEGAAELATRIELGESSLWPTLTAQVGVSYYHWDTEYENGNHDSRSTIAVSIAPGLALGFSLNQGWQLRLHVCPTGYLVPGYGGSSGMRFSMELRYLP